MYPIRNVSHGPDQIDANQLTALCEMRRCYRELVSHAAQSGLY